MLGISATTSHNYAYHKGVCECRLTSDDDCGAYAVDLIDHDYTHTNAFTVCVLQNEFVSEI